MMTAHGFLLPVCGRGRPSGSSRRVGSIRPITTLGGRLLAWAFRLFAPPAATRRGSFSTGWNNYGASEDDDDQSSPRRPSENGAGQRQLLAVLPCRVARRRLGSSGTRTPDVGPSART